jgi:hypothetical protein
METYLNNYKYMLAHLTTLPYAPICKKLLL